MATVITEQDYQQFVTRYQGQLKGRIVLMDPIQPILSTLEDNAFGTWHPLKDANRYCKSCCSCGWLWPDRGGAWSNCRVLLPQHGSPSVRQRPSAHWPKSLTRSATLQPNASSLRPHLMLRALLPPGQDTLEDRRDTSRYPPKPARGASPQSPVQRPVTCSSQIARTSALRAGYAAQLVGGSSLGLAEE